eukprot:8768468-Pyramimonas_sp.AAC.1
MQRYPPKGLEFHGLIPNCLVGPVPLTRPAPSFARALPDGARVLSMPRADMARASALSGRFGG